MKRAYLKILPYFKPYILYFLLSLIFTSIVITIVVYVPRIMQHLVDGALKNKDFLLLTRLILFGIGLLLIKEVAGYLQLYLVSYAGQRVVTDLRRDFFSHLLRLSLSFYTHYPTGNLISMAIQDITIIRETLVENFIRIIPLFFIFIGLLVKMFSVDLKLALLMSAFIPFIGYLMARFGEKGRGISKVLQESTDRLSSLIQEVITGIRTVISFTHEDYERERFNRLNEDGCRIAISRSKLMGIHENVIEFLTIGGFFGVVWLAGLELIRGNITPGELTAFFTCLVLIADPLTSISRSYFSWQKAIASIERIAEIMEIKEEVKEVSCAKIMPKVRGEVEFDEVHFSYGEREVLKGVSFRVKEGEVVAVVGRSGVGKTTLLNLIPRFYDPTKGCVRIDGTDIREFTLASLRSQIGIVPQEPLLFSGTIISNILYGKLDATKEEVIRAAKAANIHHFILGLKDGYETEVGERGVRISSGEAQRVAIARAILRDPKIIILDEPTSHLDSESERLVNEALYRLMKGRTTFIIAHRLSTVMNADRLILLDDGKIVEEGTHDELIRMNGLYATLFKAQFI